MQAFIDFVPLVLFFVVYRIYGIYPATATLMVAMVVLIAYQWFRHGKVSKMLLFSGLAALVLGGITLTLRDPTFIKWKPTIVFWVASAAFLVSPLFGGKTLTEKMLGEALEGEGSPPWLLFNLLWVASFATLGAVNLYVAYRFSEATWVNFKVFGTMGWMALTIALQVGWIWLWGKSAAPPPAGGDVRQGS